MSERSFVIIALYVDDFFVFYNNTEEAKRLKTELHKNYSIKDLVPISLRLERKIEKNKAD